MTPTLREVKDAIHQLKTNKAAGKDGIAAELIKMGPEKLATCLHQLVAITILNAAYKVLSQIIPSSFTYSK